MKNAKPIYLFGYGTLQHRAVGDKRTKDSRLATATFIGDGRLDGYMLARIAMYSEWAGAVKAEGGYVLGEVYRIPRSLVASLDSSEGYREGIPESKCTYLRKTLPVTVDGVVYDCYVYTVDHNPKTNRNVLTHTWPVAGDQEYYLPQIRRHELDPNTPSIAKYRTKRTGS